MTETVENLKKDIGRFRKKRPAYGPILDFYERIVVEQDGVRPDLHVSPPLENESLRALKIKEGFPVTGIEEIPIDMPASIRLFKAICKVGKDATDSLREGIGKIEQAIAAKSLSPEELLKRHADKPYQDRMADSLGLEKAVLNFLVYSSIKPSIDANVAKIKEGVDLSSWHHGYCPVCGSMPKISELKQDGKRSLLCSFCDFEWNVERLKCPFCDNSDQESLHYLYAEGEEAYRIDLCDRCRQYIKTVDVRKLDYEPDMRIEDIMTMHFDIIAAERGFNKPASLNQGRKKCF